MTNRCAASRDTASVRELERRPDARRAGAAGRDRRARRRRRRLRPPVARTAPIRSCTSSARRRQRRLERIASRPTRASCSSTSATTRRAIRRSRPTTTRSGTAPVVGIHNGIIVNDDELLGAHSCARAEPRMTVDSEAIFALAEAHSDATPRALRGAPRLDGDRLARRARARARSSSRAASAGRSGSARTAASSSSPRRERALEVVEQLLRRPAAQARGRARARCSRSRAAASCAASASRPIRPTSRPTRCPPCARRTSATSACTRLAAHRRGRR